MVHTLLRPTYDLDTPSPTLTEMSAQNKLKKSMGLLYTDQGKSL